MGDEEAEIEVAAIGSAAEFDFAKDGIGAEAEQSERGLVKAIDGGQGFAAGVGDGNCDESIVVPVAQLQRFTAGVGQEFGVGVFIERPVIAG